MIDFKGNEIHTEELLGSALYENVGTGKIFYRVVGFDNNNNQIKLIDEFDNPCTINSEDIGNIVFI